MNGREEAVVRRHARYVRETVMLDGTCTRRIDASFSYQCIPTGMRSFEIYPTYSRHVYASLLLLIEFACMCVCVFVVVGCLFFIWKVS